MQIYRSGVLAVVVLGGPDCEVPALVKRLYRASLQPLLQALPPPPPPLRFVFALESIKHCVPCCCPLFGCGSLAWSDR